MITTNENENRLIDQQRRKGPAGLRPARTRARVACNTIEQERCRCDKFNASYAVGDRVTLVHADRAGTYTDTIKHQAKAMAPGLSQVCLEGDGWVSIGLVVCKV